MQQSRSVSSDCPLFLQVRRVIEFEDEPCMFAVEFREDGSRWLCGCFLSVSYELVSGHRQLYEALDQKERDKWVASIETMLKVLCITLKVNGF